MTEPLSLILLVVTLAGACYLTIAALRLAAFYRQPLEFASEFLPSITILKPVAGLEPDLYDNLASFCNQRYEAPYDVIFCLPRNDDSAAATVNRVVADFPQCAATIAVGINSAMLNPKIANIAKPGVEPRGELVAIVDSDIRVGPNYLRALAASFASERVGAVTCLYSGMPNLSLSSRLGALGIQDDFIPSVLVALTLGALRFCLGSTMIVRRRVLEEVGGLAVVGDRLADDHALGELVTGQGHRIELARYVVRTTVPETTLPELWSHEIRWARTNFVLAPAGYACSFLMYALPFALLYLAVSRNLVWGPALLTIVAALRVAVHYLARSALRVAGPDDVWLIPLRDFFSLAVWGASLFGRGVRWRDRRYRMQR
jgi:ceramide glucosyltransferase